MKIETAKLQGTALEYVMGEIDGDNSDVIAVSVDNGDVHKNYCATGNYTTCWTHTGRLMQQYKIDVYWHSTYNGMNVAIAEASSTLDPVLEMSEDISTADASLLVAVCRAIVAHHYGSTVEVPDDVSTAQ